MLKNRPLAKHLTEGQGCYHRYLQDFSFCFLFTHLLPYILLFTFSACRDKDEKKVVSASIDVTGVHGTCENDSVLMTAFVNSLRVDTLNKQQLLVFYRNRNYQPAWLDGSQPNVKAVNFLDFLIKESLNTAVPFPASLAELQKLHQLISKESTAKSFCLNEPGLRFEILMTKNYFDFAARNWGGVGNDVLQQVNWFIARKQIDYEKFLNESVNAAFDFSTQEPVYRQYALLKKHLLRYHEIEQQGGWKMIPETGKTMRRGDSTQIIMFIKQQLYMLDDLLVPDTGFVFDQSLEAAVKNSREGMG